MSDMDQLRVLVVDDEPGMRRGVMRTLRNFTVNVPNVEQTVRFEIDEAESGEVALEKIEADPPDIMLLDFKLPDVNGNIVCRTIRNQPEFEHMKIIIISGVADPDEIEELKAVGADEFIRKPFAIETVIARMAEMLKL